MALAAARDPIGSEIHALYLVGPTTITLAQPDRTLFANLDVGHDRELAVAVAFLPNDVPTHDEVQQGLNVADEELHIFICSSSSAHSSLK